MTIPKRIAIIVPSFNDIRVVDSIRSIRAVDDAGLVKLIVIDGGSRLDIVSLIRALVTEDDVVISEPDKGIFDALNKGLAASDTEFVGWLGSDDMFTGQVLISTVVRELESCDLFVAGTAVYRGDRVVRLTHAGPSRWRLARFGLHNPHFSTFGRTSLLKQERFRLDLLAADIEYFLRVFNRRPIVHVTPAVSTLMGDGGFSNQSYSKVLRINLQLVSIYAKFTNRLFAPVIVFGKLAYKAASVGRYWLIRKSARSLLTDAVATALRAGT